MRPAPRVAAVAVLLALAGCGSSSSPDLTGVAVTDLAVFDRPARGTDRLPANGPTVAPDASRLLGELGGRRFYLVRDRPHGAASVLSFGRSGGHGVFGLAGGTVSPIADFGSGTPTVHVRVLPDGYTRAEVEGAGLEHALRPNAFLWTGSGGGRVTLTGSDVRPLELTLVAG